MQTFGGRAGVFEIEGGKIRAFGDYFHRAG
jgi:hypothetical protein